MKEKFFKDVGYTGIGQIVGLVTGLVSSIIIARTLGAEERGLLALVFLLPAILQGLLTNGFSAAIINYVAAGKWSKDQIIPRSLAIFVWSLIILAIGGGIALWFHDFFFKGVPVGLLAVGMLVLPLQQLSGCLGAILVGRRVFKQEMLAKVLVIPFSFLLVILFLVILDLGIAGIVYASVATALVSLAFTVRILIDDLGKKNVWQWPNMAFKDMRAAVTYGSVMHVANMASYLNYRLDQFIINAMLGSSRLGIYVIGVNNAEKMWLLSGQFSRVMFPAASEQDSNSEEFLSFTVRLTAALWSLTFLAGIAIALTVVPIVTFLYGEEYRLSGWVIVTLLPGVIALVPCKIISNYLSGRGYPNLCVGASVLSLAINIGLNFALIPHFGIFGAALATSVSYSVATIYIAISFSRITGVGFTRLFVIKKEDYKAIMLLAGKLFTKVKSRFSC